MEKLVEAHIIDFSGDLYGKEITLNFNRRMRDIKKFNGADALKEQLELDLKEIKDGKND